MKTILILVVTLALAGFSIGQGIVDKTKRMIQIEKKFDMVMENIFVDKDDKFWIFKSEFKEGILGFVPVMVKAEATDKEIDAAKLSAKACASYYDETIKEAVKKARQSEQQSPMLYQ